VSQAPLSEISRYELVRMKKMGNITELMHMQHKNTTCNIINLDKEHYILCKTGEIKQKKHIENRKDNTASVRRSLNNLRDLINTNVIDVNKCKWITLTYAENMQDPKQLYTDFKKFIMRFKYKFGKFEYIVAMEPQGRGAWHAHLIFIFPFNPGFIDNKIIANLWGFGFAKTKKLDDIDNIGTYLTAYLGDMELDNTNNDLVKDDLSNVHVVQDQEGQSKRIVKGARLRLYPPKFNLYRCSRGIQKPEISHLREYEAARKVKNQTLTREAAIQLEDEETGFKNIISYRYYNKIKKGVKNEKQ